MKQNYRHTCVKTSYFLWLVHKYDIATGMSYYDIPIANITGQN